jgi:hypothetical protein
MEEPRNFMESLRDCVAYLERCRGNPTFTKEDVLDGIEERISCIMAKMLAAPTATSYCVFRLEDYEGFG